MAPFGAIGSVVGVDVSEGLKQLASLVAGDQSSERRRERAAKELKSLAAPVLVVLDDLDRLEPAELLVTFKLVRLLGRLPNVYYLLSYDEVTLEAVLGRTDLVGSGQGRARDYLEKMVQIRIDIPPLLPEQRAALVNEGLDACLLRHEIELDEDGKSRLQQAWTHCVAQYLAQPRAAKKLIAQVDALWPEVAGEVDFVDFFLTTFLRTFERAAFELVVRERTELVGALTARTASRERESHQDRWKRWIDMLQSESVRYPEPIAILLSEMFLPLRSARQNMSFGSYYSSDLSSGRRIGSDESFDRYIQFGVPASDVSEQTIAAAVTELRNGVAGPGLEALEARMVNDAALVVRKLRRFNDVQGLPGPSTLALLARHFDEAMQQKSGFFDMSSEFAVVALAVSLLDSMQQSEAVAALANICEHGAGLELAADVLRQASFSEEQNHEHAWLATVQEPVTAVLESQLRAAAARPLTVDDKPLVKLCWSLWKLKGAAYIQDLLWQLQKDPYVWQLEDILALVVPLATASDGRRVWQSMGELGLGDIDALLGIDRVLSAVQVQTALNDTAVDRRDSGVSFDARRRYALSVVARLRAERDAAQGDNVHE